MAETTVAPNPKPSAGLKNSGSLLKVALTSGSPLLLSVIGVGTIAIAGIVAIAIGIAVLQSANRYAYMGSDRGENYQSSTPIKSVEEFIKVIAPIAVVSMHKYGIPASITIAQGIWESAHGTSKLARIKNNLFGMKNWPGIGFKSYNNWQESVDHHGERLAHSRYYKNGRSLFNNPDAYIRAIGPTYCPPSDGGCPGYAGKIIGVMRTYNLYQYDKQ